MDIARLASLVLCAALATATGPWLSPEDAPPDLPASRAGDDELPPDLSGKLAEIGIL